MANFIYVMSTGLIIPDASQTKNETEAEYRGVFGEDFIVDPETPQGSLITAEVTSRQSVVRNNAQVANQINPNVAGGPFFDAIWSLTGGSRSRATNSTVQLTCTGVAGTSIPQGTRAEDDQGNNWLAVTALIIGVDGTINGSFRAENTGPITASPNTITNIVDGVLGWETVTNGAAASPGQNQQSDISARRERRDSLALQGSSTSLAVTSALSATTGVRSWAFRENTENTTQVIDGITLSPHSIWVAVDGGADADIASSLQESKSSGSGYNGAVTEPYVDPASGQSIPVRFDRPTDVPIRLRVTARPGITTNPTSQIIDSILNYSNGESPIGNGFVTGEDVTPFEIASAINNDNNTVFVTNVEIATDLQNPNWSNDTLVIAINQIARILRSGIEVVLV